MDKETQVEMPLGGAAKKSKFPELKIKMKTLIWVLAVILILGALYYFKGLYIAAWVNGKPISRLTVIKELEKQSGATVLDNLISERLVAEEAANKKIEVSDQEVNDQIKTIEDQIKAQDSNLEDELVAAGLTMDELRKQVRTQKEMEKLLGDKLNVTDAEVNEYISGNSITIPKGEEESYMSQIKEQIKQQKLGNESQALITDLKANAKIKYFVTY